jgi:PilZ domain
MQVHLKMAICTVAGFSEGDLVLRLTPRQHGGRLPDDAHDAQLTFDHGAQLVMLNGRLRRRAEEELLFSVRDSVQVPPRRRDTRRKARLAAHVRLPSGEERDATTTDVSAGGLSIDGALPVKRGDAVTVRLDLPGGDTLTATASVVRVADSVTALRIEGFEEGDRLRLESYALAGEASADSWKPS